MMTVTNSLVLLMKVARLTLIFVKGHAKAKLYLTQGVLQYIQKTSQNAIFFEFLEVHRDSHSSH